MPLGLMMNNTRKNCLARGGVLVVVVVLAKVLILLLFVSRCLYPGGG